MPGGDRTGPRGQGPRTGGGFGYCSGYNMPGSVNPIRGGVGRGFYQGIPRGGARGGHGRRNVFYATGLYGWQRASQGMPAYGFTGVMPQSISSVDDIEILKAQAGQLESVLNDLKNRIEKLEKSSD